MKTLRLKAARRAARVRQGHPWVFAGEVEKLLPPREAGTGVGLLDDRGYFLGSGIYNPASKIVWRRYSRREMPWDASTWKPLLAAAVARRPDEPYRRLVWSEADDLPGLIADQYGDTLVLQAVTLAVDQVIESLAAELQKLTGADKVVYRLDAPTRRHEGLENKVSVSPAGAGQPAWHEIDGVAYWLDLAHSHKTGFYLDQRAEHRRIATFASGKRVLDCFCNQGSFALQAAQAGAREVWGIDSSEDALQLAEKNAEKAGLNITWHEANVFDWFKAHEAERFDLIVLDPPSFAPRKTALEGAYRGYNELHRRALKMLNPGGLLATYCCSHLVTREAFLETLDKAAYDAKRAVIRQTLTGQPVDHPVRLGYPESEYLKGVLVQVIG